MLTGWKVSIRAPVKGRSTPARLSNGTGRFNPRPREGAIRAVWFTLSYSRVSIRAPVKGR